MTVFSTFSGFISLFFIFIPYVKQSSTGNPAAGEIIKHCGCENDSLINENTTGCDTIILQNKSLLYYQFNCDSVWLTLERRDGFKNVIYCVKDNFKELYSYNYRIGYHLQKEYTNYILFISGCPATNGPCNFVLLDKSTGRLVKEYGELIFDRNTDTFPEFLLDFSDDTSSLIAGFPDKEFRQISIPVNKNHFTERVPEYQFDTVELKDNQLRLIYRSGDSTFRIRFNISPPLTD